MTLVEQVRADPDSAPIDDEAQGTARRSPRRSSEGGKKVTPEDVEAAREAGADDPEIHDTVLIAAAFCMYNRYVDGLATTLPEDPAVCDGGRGHRERGVPGGFRPNRREGSPPGPMTDTPQAHRYLIIGAGPAGLQLSYYLQRPGRTT